MQTIRTKKSAAQKVVAPVYPADLAKAARDEAQKNLNRVSKERSDLLDSFAEAHKKAFFSTGGCQTCYGRGRVCTWSTLDSLSGAYDEFGPCPEKECTAKRTGPLLHRHTTTHDRLRGIGDITSHPSYPGVVGIYDMLLKPLEAKLKAAQARVDRLLTPRKGDTAVVVKGRNVPVGSQGRVFWVGQNEWGTRLGLDTGVPDPANPGKTLAVWVAAANCSVLIEAE